jgi:hypothetical protein
VPNDGFLDARGIENWEVGVEDGGVDDGAVAGEDRGRVGERGGEGEVVRLRFRSKACPEKSRIPFESSREREAERRDAPTPIKSSVLASFLPLLIVSTSGTSHTYVLKSSLPPA